MSDAAPGIRFGAAYYHEYQPTFGGLDSTAKLDEDLDLMKAAGFTVIRVGESVWSTWEPEEGVFDLDWLEPVLDGAHARGIGVVLGTPTYAIPMWMKRRYPEVAADVATGRAFGWGMRQEVDFTHPAFLFYAERVIRRIVTRYRDHPAIVGWQVDNEPGIRLLFNTGVFQRFVDTLRHRYGDVETLNREWGLVYWSHRLSVWDDLWLPDNNFQPQYDLAWRRFQASLVTEFIGWQSDIVHEIAQPGQFTTTCLSYDQVGVDDVDITARLDITAGNAYYEMQDALAHPATTPRESGWIVKGVWAVYQLADTMWSSKQAPFLVTETNAATIGFSNLNQSPYDGQWRQAAWALVSRGARMIEYWHWQSLHFGAETYWGGVLPHSRVPGRVYHQIAALGAELAEAGDAVAASIPDADIAILFDSDSKFALASQAPFPHPATYVDTDSYRRIVSAFQRGAFDAGLQTRVVRPQQIFPSRDPAGSGISPEEFAHRHPVLVVAAFYTAGDDELDWLDAYAAAGGHLVLGTRTGYADREARARLDVKPARLVAAAGAWYDEFANLEQPLPLRAVEGSGFELPPGAAATDWVDGLVTDGADELVGYEHPHFGRWSAVTTHEHGLGNVTTVGTLPNQVFAAALMTWLVPEPLVDWPGLAPSVTVTSSTADDGTRIHFVHNWSGEPATVTLPAHLTDLIAHTGHSRSEPLVLGPWDVRVLATTSTETATS